MEMEIIKIPPKTPFPSISEQIYAEKLEKKIVKILKKLKKNFCRQGILP